MRRNERGKEKWVRGIHGHKNVRNEMMNNGKRERKKEEEEEGIRKRGRW